MLERRAIIRKNLGMLTAALLIMGFAWPLMAGDQAASSFGEALTHGKPTLNLRYRYESVDDDNYDEDGIASTIRAALGYSTIPWKGFSATVEFQSVLDLGFLPGIPELESR